MAETTPMMAQYLSIKEQYRDAVLFFRLGDFYEMFNEDAVEVSRLLNLTLTQRAGHPMCGIPTMRPKCILPGYCGSGKRSLYVNRCPRMVRGKVFERKVREVITPGTVVDEDFLDRGTNNYLASLALSQSGKERFFSFSYIDISTGDFAATRIEAVNAPEKIRRELGRVEPSELLLQQSLLETVPELDRILQDYPAMIVNRFPDWSFNQEMAYRKLLFVVSNGELPRFP